MHNCSWMQKKKIIKLGLAMEKKEENKINFLVD